MSYKIAALCMLVLIALSVVAIANNSLTLEDSISSEDFGMEISGEEITDNPADEAIPDASISETEVETDAEVDSEVETNNEAETEVEVDSEVDTGDETEVDTEIENDTEVETNTEVKVDSEVDNGDETEVDTEIENDTEVETNTEVKVESEVDAGDETEVDTEVESGTNTEVETEAETADTEVKPEAETGAEVGEDDEFDMVTAIPGDKVAGDKGEGEEELESSPFSSASSSAFAEVGEINLFIKEWYPKMESDGVHYVFVCETPGFEPSHYDWFYDDGHKLLNIQNGDTYHIFQKPGTYTVTCVAKTEGGAMAKDSLTIQVPSPESAFADVASSNEEIFVDAKSQSQTFFNDVASNEEVFEDAESQGTEETVISKLESMTKEELIKMVIMLLDKKSC